MKSQLVCLLPVTDARYVENEIFVSHAPANQVHTTKSTARKKRKIFFKIQFARITKNGLNNFVFVYLFSCKMSWEFFMSTETSGHI